jgi:hypothetical protein
MLTASINCQSERSHHQRWAEKIGPDGLEAYKQEHSLVSIDGLPTALKKQQIR